MNKWNLVQTWVVVSGSAGHHNDKLRTDNLNLALWLEQASDEDIVALSNESDFCPHAQEHYMADGPKAQEAIRYLGTRYRDVGEQIKAAESLGLPMLLMFPIAAFQRWVDNSVISAACKNAVDTLLGQ